MYASWILKASPQVLCFIVLANQKCGRKIGNESFTNFIKTNSFSRYSDLFELFTCSFCESIDDSGNRFLDRIFMNGTSLGILGNLPDFVRHKKLVSTVKNNWANLRGNFLPSIESMMLTLEEQSLNSAGFSIWVNPRRVSAQ